MSNTNRVDQIAQFMDESSIPARISLLPMCMHGPQG